ncbi:3-phosphoserine/phosphohydroxythreonine transaminase [Spiribacter salinus]|jgi:phosphoserine aminotransferase|uniref:3-phosphoserine/phosphohydroxythreonine transaminase n=1 Tax=Spiribacter salinus TaxID=1335746 RepID=UPI001C98488F|nr:3-phosphoserine/phosphohydroxythreonine transaminase [Spiribacter salinus]MBY5267992.1 phosphoserine transaminase [Spiribacter salinus]MDR9454112.1 3-phosphoserine/phosphohydroxythreonine transaminase [Spiribacter sp.]
MARVYNFSAGPAVLPEPVLEQAASEMLDWHGTGMSVMEMSHRGKSFVSIAEQAEAALRELLAVPDNYKVLFLQGGATAQFAAVPLNLLGDASSVDYLNSGSWSKKAIAEAKNYTSVNVVAEGGNTDPMTIPPQAEWALDPNAAYLHYCANETITGVELHEPPQVGDVPLVSDMSSTFLSRPIDVSRYGVIYAGAQKNFGPAGLTVVIVRDDLLDRASHQTPSVWHYQRQAEADSMLNTPATYSWYIAGLVFQWLQAEGGLSAMGERNQRKAARLYAAIDASDFYRNPVAPEVRSLMNVPFVLADDQLDGQFLDEAAKAGLHTLKGHRSVGGMRASIYNAMPEAGVDALIDFMADFERRHG